MVLSDTAAGPLVGPSQETSVASARVTAASALVWTAGQPLGPVGESPASPEEPRSQPTRTVAVTSRARAAGRTLKTLGAGLRLPCTGTPRGGSERADGAGGHGGGAHGSVQGTVPVVPPSRLRGDGGRGGSAGGARAPAAPARTRAGGGAPA